MGSLLTIVFKKHVSKRIGLKYDHKVPGQGYIEKAGSSTTSECSTCASYTDAGKLDKTVPPVNNPTNRFRPQQLLAHFVDGGFSKMRGSISQSASNHS